MSELHAQTVAFARDTMMPPAPPPARERGAVRWLRENLFSGPLNIALTILSLWLLWFALREALPWAWRGIWDAGSLTECRAKRDALYGPGVPAACWAVIPARWRQLVFGFYPAESIWRPVAALIVFLLGIAPVLFAGLPRRMLWLTAAMPFLCAWLIWGGPVWGPAAVALGLGLAAMAGRAAGGQGGALAGFLAFVAVILVWFLDPLSWALNLVDLLWGLGTGREGLTAASPLRDLLPVQPHVAGALTAAVPIGLTPVPSDQIGGFTLSLLIGLSGITLSLPLGILLALARRSDLWLVSAAAVVYIEVIRGVPLIVWLLVAQILLNYFLPPGTSFDILLRVIIMVTLFASAYLAEVIRGGLAAIPRGQFEAASSLGLGYWESMRLIVLPQALKISIPGIVNSFIGLLKDTTLVSIISLFDPMRVASTLRATTEWGGIYWELYIFVAAVFFVFCFAMSRYSIWLERRLERSHR